MSTNEPTDGSLPPPAPQFRPLPPDKPWHQRPAIVIVLVVVGIVVAGHTIEWIQKATTDERAQFIDAATSEGVSAADATCIADAIEQRYGNVGDIPETREGFTESLEAGITCRGDLVSVPSDVSACMVHDIAERYLPADGDFDEVISVLNDLESSDKRFIMASSLACQGVSDAVAECIVDTMVEQVDPELFERDVLDLTPGELAALQQITYRCERRNA